MKLFAEHYMTKSSITEDQNLYVSVVQLRELRIRANLTQPQAADYLWVKPRTYKNWEHGITKIPRGYLELLRYKASEDGLI